MFSGWLRLVPVCAELAGLLQASYSIVADAVSARAADGPGEPAAGSAPPGRAGAADSSLEHYALCRCGHSQNKPFCSGMHWYVGFADPVPAPGHEPTLFEWAGGLAALTRMSRLLYEKHVPADPVLAPAFASMPPGQPDLLAGWLAEALGGPAGAAPEGGVRQVTGFGEDAGEEHRARWAALAAQAADDAQNIRVNGGTT